MTLSKGSVIDSILYYYYYYHYFIPNLLARHALTELDTGLAFAGFGSATGSQETQFVFRVVEFQNFTL